MDHLKPTQGSLQHSEAITCSDVLTGWMSQGNAFFQGAVRGQADHHVVFSHSLAKRKRIAHPHGAINKPTIMLCHAICFLPCVVACLLAVYDHYHHIIRSTDATSSGTLEIQQLTGRKHSELTLLSAERSSSAGGTLHSQCTAGAVRDRVATLPSSFDCHTGRRCSRTSFLNKIPLRSVVRDLLLCQ